MVWQVLYWVIGLVLVIRLVAVIVGSWMTTSDRPLLLGLQIPVEPWARAELNLWRRAQTHRRLGRTVLRAVGGLASVFCWFLWPLLWEVNDHTMVPVLAVVVVDAVLTQTANHAPGQLGTWVRLGSPVISLVFVAWAATVIFIPWPAVLLVVSAVIGLVGAWLAQQLRWRRFDLSDPLTRALSDRPAPEHKPLPGARGAWYQARAYSRRIPEARVREIADHLANGSPPVVQWIHWTGRLRGLAVDLGVIESGVLLDDPPKPVLKRGIVSGSAAEAPTEPESDEALHVGRIFAAQSAVEQIAHTNPIALDPRRAELACVWHLARSFEDLRMYRPDGQGGRNFGADDIDLNDRDAYWAPTKVPVDGLMPPA